MATRAFATTERQRNHKRNKNNKTVLWATIVTFLHLINIAHEFHKKTCLTRRLDQGEENNTVIINTHF